MAEKLKGEFTFHIRQHEVHLEYFLLKQIRQPHFIKKLFYTELHIFSFPKANMSFALHCQTVTHLSSCLLICHSRLSHSTEI